MRICRCIKDHLNAKGRGLKHEIKQMYGLTLLMIQMYGALEYKRTTLEATPSSIIRLDDKLRMPKTNKWSPVIKHLSNTIWRDLG